VGVGMMMMMIASSSISTYRRASACNLNDNYMPIWQHTKF